MMRKLGLEFLGVFGLSPVDLVHLAADLDCQFIGTVPAPIDYNPEGYAPWDLLENAALRRDLKSALAERGIELLIGDGNAFLPGVDARERLAPHLDLYQELGVKRVNSISFEPSLEKSYDQFATFVEMAVERGLKPSIEFCPISVVNNLAAGVGAVKHAGEHARLLIDTMHFLRSDSTVEELVKVADLVGHIQLCDAPAEPTIADYLEEAMFERVLPGDGDVPLREILNALPNVESVGLEIPLRSLAEQGIGPRERTERCVAAARKVLAQADAGYADRAIGGRTPVA
ncbi:MAG: sugar phosphate isomerase/epimerase family protein [Sphingomonadales bacterium]